MAESLVIVENGSGIVSETVDDAASRSPVPTRRSASFRNASPGLDHRPARRTTREPGGWRTTKPRTLRNKSTDELDQVLTKASFEASRGSDPPCIVHDSSYRDDGIEMEPAGFGFATRSPLCSPDVSADYNQTRASSKSPRDLPMTPNSSIPIDSIMDLSALDRTSGTLGIEVNPFVNRDESLWEMSTDSPDTPDVTKDKAGKKRAMLDVVLGHVDSLLCRQNSTIPSPQRGDATSLSRDKGMNNSLVDEEDLIRESSNMRSNPLEIQEEDRDGLHNGGIMMCRKPKPKFPPQDLPSVATQPTASDSTEGSAYLHDVRKVDRSQSLLDAMMQASSSMISSEEEAETQGRLDSIRRKKRDIEAQVQSRSAEPGVLIPRGYKSKPPPSMQPVPDTVETAERRKFRKYMALGFVIFLIVAALVLVGVSFFWPSDKLGGVADLVEQP